MVCLCSHCSVGSVYVNMASWKCSFFSAVQHHHWLVVSDKEGVLEIWRTPCGQQLWLCPWHHPHVFHPLFWHLHLLHGPEEIQDQSLFSNHCKSLLSPKQSVSLLFQSAKLSLPLGVVVTQRGKSFAGKPDCIWRNKNMVLVNQGIAWVCFSFHSLCFWRTQVSQQKSQKEQ